MLYSTCFFRGIFGGTEFEKAQCFHNTHRLHQIIWRPYGKKLKFQESGGTLAVVCLWMKSVFLPWFQQLSLPYGFATPSISWVILLKFINNPHSYTYRFHHFSENPWLTKSVIPRKQFCKKLFYCPLHINGPLKEVIF